MSLNQTKPNQNKATLIFASFSSIEQSVESVSNNDLFLNLIKNFHEVFKARFNDLLSMEIPESIISLIDVEMKGTNLDFFLQE